MLTVHPDERRKIVRVLGEVEAADQRWEGGPGGRTEREVFARRSRPPVTLGPPLSRLRRSCCEMRAVRVLSAFEALSMPILAAYPGMMKCARKREGLSSAPGSQQLVLNFCAGEGGVVLQPA